MNVSFCCPHCDQGVRLHFSATDTGLNCPQCGHAIAIPEGAIQGERVCRCLVCPSADLFLRKDFPQRLGVGIVTIGIVGSCISWAMSEITLTFAILFATALIDVVLYLIVPDALMCYRCGAMYRQSEESGHEPFNLETHERYRQQAARMAGPAR
jgi:DNA-directed RNA polymerase subunit RPC12/RpoP